MLARALAENPADLSKRVSLLRAAHLLQTAGARGVDAIDVYHDRIRAAVLARLDRAEKQSLHHRLARALEGGGGNPSDAEALAIHWKGAGDSEHAAHYALIAADHAATALAFEHAARLYRLALALRERPAEETRALHIKLGEALANAGRGALAAQAFQIAAEGANAAPRLELLSRAAGQLLRAGHVDDGLNALSAVLSIIGWVMPRTPAIAILLYF